MNKLNVLTYGFLPWRLCNLWHNFRQLWRNLRYVLQRATKGYCDQDLWNLDYFYSQLFVNTLTDFPKQLHGAPSKFYDEESDSISRWIDYINEMRDHFYNSIEENEVEKNEFEDDYMFIAHGDINDHIIGTQLSREQNEARELWLKREKEINDWRANELKTAFNMLENVYEDLWD